MAMKGRWIAAVVAIGGIATLWAALASRPRPTPPPAPARMASRPAPATEIAQEASPTALLVREVEKELLALCDERDRLLREKNQRGSSRKAEDQIRIDQAEIEIRKHLRDGHRFLNDGKPLQALQSFERAEAALLRTPYEIPGMKEVLHGVRAAKEKAQAALAGTPRPASVADEHYRLALSYFQRNELQSAKAECVNAIQADPHHVAARSLQRELEFLLQDR
jgi:hypothetical protein